MCIKKLPVHSDWQFCRSSEKNQRLENWGARRAAFRPYFLRPLVKSPLFSTGISHISKNAPQNEPHFGLEAKAAVTLEIKSLG